MTDKKNISSFQAIKIGASICRKTHGIAGHYVFIKQVTNDEIKKGIQFIEEIKNDIKIAYLFLPGNAMFPAKRKFLKGIMHVHKSYNVSNKKLKKIALAYNPMLEVLVKRKVQKIFLIAPYFRLTWESPICDCKDFYKKYNRNHIKKCNAIVLRQLKKQCVNLGLDFRILDIADQEPALLGDIKPCSTRKKMFKILDCDQVHFARDAHFRLSTYLRSQGHQAISGKC